MAACASLVPNRNMTTVNAPRVSRMAGRSSSRFPSSSRFTCIATFDIEYLRALKKSELARKRKVLSNPPHSGKHVHNCDISDTKFKNITENSRYISLVNLKDRIIG